MIRRRQLVVGGGATLLLPAAVVLASDDPPMQRWRNPGTRALNARMDDDAQCRWAAKTYVDLGVLSEDEGRKFLAMATSGRREYALEEIQDGEKFPYMGFIDPATGRPQVLRNVVAETTLWGVSVPREVETFFLTSAAELKRTGNEKVVRKPLVCGNMAAAKAYRRGSPDCVPIMRRTGSII